MLDLFMYIQAVGRLLPINRIPGDLGSVAMGAAEGGPGWHRDGTSSSSEMHHAVRSQGQILHRSLNGLFQGKATRRKHGVK